MTKQKTESTALLPGDSVENIRHLVLQSAENIQRAADMLHRLYLSDKTVVEKLTSGKDGLPEGFINGLLRVGERSLHPKLLINRCPAYRKLSLMSYETQTDVINKGSVEVVIGQDDGNVIMVDVTKLEGEQLNQVISHAGLRSRDEQLAWMKRKTVASAAPKDVGPPYEIKRDRLRVLRGNFELTKVEILRLLELMVA